MTNEEARAYFIDCNERIISVAKDENIYNYETQQVEDVFMRRTFEANELAIKALEQDPQETVTEFADRCRECGARYGRLLNQKWIPVSERLPEKSTWVLVTCKNPDGYIFLDIKLINRYTELWDGDEDFIGTVLAWMPLPEPYKEEDRGGLEK